jgi:hypothetical protein
LKLLPFTMPKKPRPPPSKDLAIFYGKIKGFAHVSQEFTLKDVRALILQEFDDDMTPGDGDFCFHINDFRISRKQEGRKLAWDLFKNRQVLSLHPKNKANTAPKRRVEEDIRKDANESNKQGQRLQLTISSHVKSPQREEIKAIVTPQVQNRPAPAVRAETFTRQPTASKKRPHENKDMAIRLDTSDTSSRSEEPQEATTEVQETRAAIPAARDGAIPGYASVSAVCNYASSFSGVNYPNENGQERRYIRLSVTVGSLGITLSTKKLSIYDKIGSTDAFVSNVLPGGPLDGIVSVGDAIVSVNGDDVRRCRLSDVKHILKSCDYVGPWRWLTFMHIVVAVPKGNSNKRDHECAPKEPEETHKRIRNAESRVQPTEPFNTATTPSAISKFADDSTNHGDGGADSEDEEEGTSRQTTSTQKYEMLPPARHSEDGADSQPQQNAISSTEFPIFSAVGIFSSSQMAAAVKLEFEAMIDDEIQIQRHALASTVPERVASSIVNGCT